MTKETQAFQLAADRLSEWTFLDTLAARGTIRILLREAGLEAGSVRAVQLAVVVRRLLPGALRARRVADVEDVSARVAGELDALGDGADRDTPERIFARMAPVRP